jgi:methanogenic corrinoid protein MtbC1
MSPASGDPRAALVDAIVNMREDEAVALVHTSLGQGAAPGEVLDASRAAMTELGRRFERGEAFIPELVMGGEIMRAIAGEAQPLLSPGESTVKRGRIVLGTVAGDIHDIGKDIVGAFLRLGDCEVVDLGVDVPASRFVDEAWASPTDIVALSGLLTLAFDAMKETADALREAGLRPRLKVMVGGAPVDALVCSYVGADGWGADAPAAVRLADEWLGA